MILSVGDLEKMIIEANEVNLISLNKKWYETDSYKDVREIDILEDKKGEDPTRRIQKNDLMRLVTKGLNRNERLIIILYYYEELTMKEIGATLDLSESRVSQMHSSIVQRLQSQLQRRRPNSVRNRQVGGHAYGTLVDSRLVRCCRTGTPARHWQTGKSARLTREGLSSYPPTAHGARQRGPLASARRRSADSALLILHASGRLCDHSGAIAEPYSF